VSRQARIALDRDASTIGADRLARIFADTPHPHIRRQTLSQIDKLSKWQKLPLLIAILGGTEASTRTTAENFIRSWLSNYNRTPQVQPTKLEATRLRAAIEAHGSKFERRLERELRAVAGIAL